MSKTPPHAGNAPGPIAQAALGLIWLYKRTLSPVIHLTGARCQHLPGCSDYAAEAFRRHGFWRGFWLSLSRVSRCHPFGSHGWDPAPASLPDHGLAFWRYGDWSWSARPAPCDNAENGRDEPPERHPD